MDINEVSEKIVTTINSCETVQQSLNTNKLIRNFSKMFDEYHIITSRLYLINNNKLEKLLNHESERLIFSFIVYFDGCYMVDPMSSVTTYQLGVTDLRYDYIDNALIVELRRPGLLIGKAGKDLKKLEEYLGCKIHIEEKRLV